ncbi:MAG TPA: divergent PAP2 family protein [Peptococcaceae bacterium]|nr:divergent PAP2 family protein [Peptococcaceae bacterium]
MFADFFPSILQNKIMWISLSAWILAQAAKLVINFLVEKKWDFSLLISSGGFPSSHTAIVSALALSVGKVEGWDSSVFAIAVVLAVIVMYDAAGVRRAAGNHARVINYMVEWLRQFNADRSAFNLQEERLKELIGHTPFEVFGGAILGGLIGLIF